MRTDSIFRNVFGRAKIAAVTRREGSERMEVRAASGIRTLDPRFTKAVHYHCAKAACADFQTHPTSDMRSDKPGPGVVRAADCPPRGAAVQ